MLTIIFAVLATVLGIRYLATWLGCKAIVKYMKDKGYAPPTKVEVDACCAAVVQELLHKK